MFPLFARRLLSDLDTGLIAFIMACTWSTSSELMVSLKSIVIWSYSGEVFCYTYEQASDSRTGSGLNVCALNAAAMFGFSEALGLVYGEIVNESLASSIANRFSSFSYWVSIDGEVADIYVPASAPTAPTPVSELSSGSVFVSENPLGPGDMLAEHLDVFTLSASTIWYS